MDKGSMKNIMQTMQASTLQEPQIQTDSKKDTNVEKLP